MERKQQFTCGMTLATNQDRRLDRLEIDGTKGSITGTKFAFNGDGELSYTIRTAEGAGRSKDGRSSTELSPGGRTIRQMHR